MPTDKSIEPQALVSVICRTVGRPELKQAVQSLQSQSYPNLELILVDAAGSGISAAEILCDPVSLKIVSPGKALSRSQAANAGLDEASGDYLMFLDDDDWIGSEHIRDLLNFLTAQTKFKAAYSSTQKTDPDGTPIDYIFAQDFDPLLLMRDNYIPIHSIVFHRSLLDHDCRFDDSFDIYEDWDFWLQLSRHTDFYHLPVVSAFYRDGGDSQTAAADEIQRFQNDSVQGKARAAIFNKWKQVWEGVELNALIGTLYEERVTQLKQLKAQIIAQQKFVEKKSQEASSLKSTLQREREDKAHLSQQILESKAHLSQQILESKAHLSQQILESKAHVDRVERAHQMIEDSVFWKMTSPLRNIRDMVSSDKDTDPLFQGSDELAEADVENESSNSKTAHDKFANQKLSEFLSSSEKLVFPASENPAVSIILVLFKQAHLSLGCIKSILEFVSTPYELILVDNNSTDATPELLSRLKNVKILRNEGNLGFVKAVNQGAAIASGANILLLNNDALLEKDTVENALKTLQSDSSIGAVGAKIKLLDGKLQEAGSIIWNDGSCLGYGRNETIDKGEFNFQRDVDYCSGAFLLFARSDFEALEGFDEQFSPAYYEESDFCIRLKQSGKRIVYCPDAQITHYEFASTGGFDSASELQIAHRELLLNKHADYLSERQEKSVENVLAARTANNFPNVLIIDDRVPYPHLGAGYPRCSHILKELSQLPLNISFYPLQFPNDDWSSLYGAVPKSVEVILDRGRAGLADFLLEREGFYDFMMVSRIHNMEFVDELLEQHPNILGEARLFYDAEAVSSPREVLKRRLLGEEVTKFEAESLIEREIGFSSDAEKIVVVSDNEAELYRQHDYQNTVVLGHALTSQASPNTFEQRNGILFVGALRDEGSPNVDSLLWFIINILPLIENKIPGITLNVVGGNGATSLASINKSNVHFTGELDSLDEMYNSNRIFIAPTRFAAGIPHKIHEAAANGIPSVATSLLCNQLSWQDGKQILSADTEEDFAEQCIKLYSDKNIWGEIRAASLTAIEKDCSENDFREKLASLFDL
ncbi:MAG: glycosyltransferase [Gammaproteobacteria bacterium]|jgi:GT2 family glycosyltransferase|nr:glycosyltransferase [Gammaproteobacteria bacterium]MBT3858598.1 glycosyltransferase [Gammaproteobacteria bacterium]MBT3986664.1 glycosyltransferase [Gammaproteobacteria bacterium]MBT4582760.1 glycosyltransferase [Gammaproteobacteria bacterium]MBT4657483.1 glycosyltransferase [Gammaproteobacteria bacterium]